MDHRPDIDAETILNALGDAVYVTDVNRKFVYWNRAAERITGWCASGMVGKSCFDGMLAHVDKDGHAMCGREHCPLHRSIVTGATHTCTLAFAQRSDGRRIPVEMTVSPICDGSGAIIGGVEVFHDISALYHDLEKAQAIQFFCLQPDLPSDGRIRFSSHYIPRDVVGGDFYGFRQLDADRYGFFLADVMGHGIAAALYTMYLSALWDRYWRLIEVPSDFAAKMNSDLGRVVKAGEAFAAGLCGMIDLARRECVIAGAGVPPAVIARSSGSFDVVECPGHPLGIKRDCSYEQCGIDFCPGDRLLAFSDGAIEIHDAQGKMLGVDGFVDLLKRCDYPRSGIFAAALEEELLKYSDVVRLEDDLTLLEICFTPEESR